MFCRLLGLMKGLLVIGPMGSVLVLPPMQGMNEAMV